MIEGFRFTMDARENNQFLPLNRRMFFRHSMVECLASGAAVGMAHLAACNTAAPGGEGGGGGGISGAQPNISAQEDRMILELLLRQNDVKDKLVEIMQALYKVRLSCTRQNFICSIAL